MKILVIDDKVVNRESAVNLLPEHEVMTVGSYDEAMDLICGVVNPRDVYKALGRPWHGGICRDAEFDAKEKELKPNFDFDVVLIDLMMPASDRTLGDRCEHRRGEQMPYGFPLMIKVATLHSNRVKDIAVVSDVSHHNHAMSATLDCLQSCYYRPVVIEGVSCSFIHARLQLDGSKDWDYTLKQVFNPRHGKLE